jgi:hypothetical protein
LFLNSERHFGCSWIIKSSLVVSVACVLASD